MILDTRIQALTTTSGSVKGIIGVSRNITNETLNQKLANELANFVETRKTDETLSNIIDLLKTQLPKSIPYILDFNPKTNKLTHLASDKNMHTNYKKRFRSWR